MLLLIRREFEVNVPLEQAWKHLARVESWPRWAKHIRSVELTPSGEVTAQTSGVFHLSSGLRAKFTMTAFEPAKRWKWTGDFLWLTIDYDHEFQALDAAHTRMIWSVSCAGFGAPVFGRVFAAIYNRNLDRAIPNLIAEVNGTNATPSPSN